MKVSSLFIKLTVLCLASMLYTSQSMATDAIDREHAIEIAKEQNGEDGKVLGVTTETNAQGITRFAVKILSNGRIRVFNIIKAP